MEHYKKFGAGQSSSVQTLEKCRKSLKPSQQVPQVMWLIVTEGDIDSELKSHPHWAETILNRILTDFIA